jgi:hypothetical protein
MKHKSIELDVDYIGGQDPMTKEEEKAISEFIKAHKSLNPNKQIKKTKAVRQRKVTA